jgi:hypothetical protein
MTLVLERYEDQRAHWPKSGKHILAQFDDESIIFYQAYKPSIGERAARDGRFGGEFSFSRMSWIKPNFLWMMFRSGWGTKTDQEVTLAIRLKRAGFDEILSNAVSSSVVTAGSPDVRLQWDPDHDPSGNPVERRAIQLGLRGKALRRFNDEWIVATEDISAFVASNRGAHRSLLVTPRERVYPVSPATQARLGM